MRIEVLEGRKIEYIKGNSEDILFMTDKGPVNFYANGDCCSNSWFEHFEGVKSLIGSTVKSIEYIDLDVVGLSSKEKVQIDEGELKIYGLKIITDKGYVQIEMRNSSNGYYGGYISVSTDINDSLPELTEDF